MGRVVRIPVRVLPSAERESPPSVEETLLPRTYQRQTGKSALPEGHPADDERVAVAPAPVEEDQSSRRSARGEETDWADRALRLQAEMENYRKRQQRLAQDQIEAERQRMLRAFLSVVDDLERALETPVGAGGGLRQGVQLTHRTALQLLVKEGVERLQPKDQPFDPTSQEAVSTVAHRQVGAAPDTVFQVLEAGYRLDGQLLRPAKVVVAV
jgi:molecular chaperone GrpE